MQGVKSTQNIVQYVTQRYEAGAEGGVGTATQYG
jgi:hypothetical protein